MVDMGVGGRCFVSAANHAGWDTAATERRPPDVRLRFVGPALARGRCFIGFASALNGWITAKDTLAAMGVVNKPAFPRPPIKTIATGPAVAQTLLGPRAWP